MASIRKRNGRWNVAICVRGKRKSATFTTLVQARTWAAQTEADIVNAKLSILSNDRIVDTLLERYQNTVTTKKAGWRQERYRIEALRKLPLAKVKLAELNPAHLVSWRDQRLREVGPSSILKEWSLLSNAFRVAIREWGWLHTNPLTDLARPKAPPPRDRRISDREIEKLLYVLGYEYDAPPETKTAVIGAVFLFAIETAMRAGEIVGLRWECVDLSRRYLKVVTGKTQAARRDVPLSTEAIRLLNQMKKLNNKSKVFPIDSASLDALFRKARNKAGIEDLHFHDTRHEAITRLAKKIDVLDLARMVGHKDLKMLMVYYNASAADIATRLD